MSAIETAADSALVVLGVNVTAMVQLDPAASVDDPDGQVLVWAKSAAFVPLRLILVMVSAAVPLLVRVIVWAPLVVPTFWLPKFTLLGLSVTAGAGAVVAVPESATVCGLPGASSLMLMLAVRVPAAVGVKVTLIVQLPEAATVAPQVVVRAKSPALVPLTATPLMLRVALPVLVSVTVCAALVVLTT